MSVFNPEDFMRASVDGAMDTHLTPIPHGDYQGQVTKAVVKQFDADSGETYTVLEVSWHILSEEAKKTTGVEKPHCKQSVFIDLTPEGGLDNNKGRNTQLGALREAVGQNSKGKKWNPDMLAGAMALCKVGPDKKDPENYSRVTKVAKAA